MERSPVETHLLLFTQCARCFSNSWRLVHVLLLHFASTGIGKASRFVRCYSTHYTRHSTSWQKVNYIPGYRLPFSPISTIGALLPTTWWNLGYNWSWVYRETCKSIIPSAFTAVFISDVLSHLAFFNFSRDVMSIVPVFVGTPTLYTCSVDVLKQLVGNENKLHLVKPLHMTLHR